MIQPIEEILISRLGKALQHKNAFPPSTQFFFPHVPRTVPRTVGCAGNTGFTLIFLSVVSSCVWYLLVVIIQVHLAIFFEPIFFCPQECRLYMGYGYYPYAPAVCHLLRMVLLEEVIQYAALGPLFWTTLLFLFPIFLHLPQRLWRGGDTVRGTKQVLLQKKTFRGIVPGRTSVDTAWARTFLHCSVGWFFFSAFPLPSFTCACLAADLWVSCACWLVCFFYFFFYLGGICLHCFCGLALFSLLVYLPAYLCQSQMMVTLRVWCFQNIWNLFNRDSPLFGVTWRVFWWHTPTINGFLISISDHTLNSLYTYVL